jgi:membrane-bound lytic murein transglycosylase D
MRSLSFCLLLLNALISAANTTPVVPREITFGNLKLVLTRQAINEIQKDVEALTRSPKYYQLKIDRMHLYFPIIENIFKEEGVPDDFKYLSLQESGLISDAVSTSNAVGFWQFKDFTAREVGLRVDKQIDERKNIVSSTRGAAVYLKRNNFLMNNWIYAMSAYQAGMGGAKKYIDQSKYGAKVLEINENTHWYVKKFLAHKIAFQDQLKERNTNGMTLIEYTKGQNKTLSQIAKDLKVAEDDVRNYNKWLAFGAVPEDKEYVVVVPVLNKNEHKRLSQVKEDKKISVDDKRDWIDEKIYPSELINGLSLNANSKKIKINRLEAVIAGNLDNINSLTTDVGLSTKTFYRYNDMEEGRKIIGGQVYYIELKNVRSEIGFHVVKEGETSWSIAQRYGIQLKKLLAMNRLPKNAPLKVNRILWLNAKRPKKSLIQYYKPIEPVITAIEPITQEQPNNEIKQEQIETPVIQASIVKESTPEKINRPEPTIIGQVDTHLVIAGESLWSIAQKYGVSVIDLKNWNELTPNENLSIDQVLNIRPPENQQSTTTRNTKTYKVKSGDTFYSVARQFNMKMEELMRLNKRVNDVLSIGDELMVYTN